MSTKTNMKRWLLAALGAFVMYVVLQTVLHGMLLSDLYQQTASVWRSETEMQRLMWVLWLSYLIASLAFAFIYTKGYEPGKSGLGQGLRFGFLMGLFIASLQSLGHYFSLPVPCELVIYWFVGGLVITTITGGVVGLIYRK
ncbi:MAG: hypothetical protein HY308_05895 [Gammaproteobacteria bacterium]|nr:hypothetical protein [Gammaproteobacteria bacterium]